MKALDPTEWFQITRSDRDYLRKLLFEEQAKHEPGTDEYRRSLRMYAALIEE